MTEFKSARGHTFAVGKNMANGFESAALISWSDPSTGSWECSLSNQAGCMFLPFDVLPDTEIRQIDEDTIRFGETFEFRYVGDPYVYGVFTLDGKPLLYPAEWVEDFLPARDAEILQGLERRLEK